MMRASFFAGGMFVIMLGLSTMFVDKLVLYGKDDPKRDPSGPTAAGESLLDPLRQGGRLRVQGAGTTSSSRSS